MKHLNNIWLSSHKKIKIIETEKTKQKKIKTKYMFYNNVQDKIIIFVLYLTCFGFEIKSFL
jgi:hypothetical protein